MQAGVSFEKLARQVDAFQGDHVGAGNDAEDLLRGFPRRYGLAIHPEVAVADPGGHAGIARLEVAFPGEGDREYPVDALQCLRTRGEKDAAGLLEHIVAVCTAHQRFVPQGFQAAFGQGDPRSGVVQPVAVKNVRPGE